MDDHALRKSNFDDDDDDDDSVTVVNSNVSMKATTSRAGETGIILRRWRSTTRMLKLMKRSIDSEKSLAGREHPN